MLPERSCDIVNDAFCSHHVVYDWSCNSADDVCKKNVHIIKCTGFWTDLFTTESRKNFVKSPL